MMRFTTTLFCLAIVCFLEISFNQSGIASPLFESWTAPKMISQDEPSHFAEVIADNFGKAHAVWAEKLANDCNYDTVMYSVFNNGEWAEPTDILISPVPPYCVGDLSIMYNPVDQRLYVAWVDYRLYISSAPVNEAFLVNAWTKPIIIDEAAFRPRMAIDSTGRVHLVYFRGVPFWEYYYTYSDDSGKTWFNPELLHRVPTSYIAGRINISVDKKDRVHVAWTEGLVSEGVDAGGTVYYNRSLDRGDTWDIPVVVDEKDERYQSNYGAGEINVISWSEDDVMLVWAGPPDSHRTYQTSSDGGETWKTPKPVVQRDVMNGLGLRNYNDDLDMAVDGSDRVHLLTSGSLHLVHLVYSKGVWSDLDIMFDYEPFAPRLTIINGNQLIYIGVNNKDNGQSPLDQNRVWTRNAITDASFIAPKPTTDLQPQVTPTPKPHKTLQPESTAQTPKNTNHTLQIIATPDSNSIVILPMALVLLFISIIMFIKLKCRS